jgi:crotonobetainyl-CoA:carnitine CoA-transferase CaiB-like acyl-CoA transferase
MWNYYQTKDGRWIQLAMLQTDRHWHDFCQALELGEVEADRRFANHELRGDNSPALIAILEQAFAKKTLEEWVERFQGRNIIWGYVNTFAQVGEDPQLWENEYLINLEHPVAGPIKFVGLPVQLSKTPGRIEKPAPELGQHTEEVLLEAGYSWDEILQLKEKGVIL